MAKFTSLDDFKLLPHPDYINRFKSGKAFLIDLFGEDFYSFLKLHMKKYSTPKMWKKVNQMYFYQYSTPFQTFCHWDFIKNYFESFITYRDRGLLSEYLMYGIEPDKKNFYMF